jgi:putative alpha-1,2-mannosidase
LKSCKPVPEKRNVIRHSKSLSKGERLFLLYSFLSNMKLVFTFLLISISFYVMAQPADQVNVFLGSSGDHGQMSPAASYPFGMLSIGPETYPKLHMGYEYKAKRFLGFTHNRFEGVGCQGSGGNILIKPYLGDDPEATVLIKSNESAGTGFYNVTFTNQIKVAIAVNQNTGVEVYSFPDGGKGFFIDLSHTLANQFVAEGHQEDANGISGWVDARTTCNVGTYRVYYALRFSEPVQFADIADHQLAAKIISAAKRVQIRIAFSSVDVAHA